MYCACSYDGTSKGEHLRYGEPFYLTKYDEEYKIQVQSWLAFIDSRLQLDVYILAIPHQRHGDVYEQSSEVSTVSHLAGQRSLSPLILEGDPASTQSSHGARVHARTGELLIHASVLAMQIKTLLRYCTCRPMQRFWSSMKKLAELCEYIKTVSTGKHWSNTSYNLHPVCKLWALLLYDTCRTVFGREYEISAHTVLDDHKFETEPNHWSFTMNEPGDVHNPGPIFFVCSEHK